MRAPAEFFDNSHPRHPSIKKIIGPGASNIIYQASLILPKLFKQFRPPFYHVDINQTR